MRGATSSTSAVTVFWPGPRRCSRARFRSSEVKTIAERAAVGKATIYSFFDSGQDLLLTIVEENLPVAEAFFAELRKDGCFTATDTPESLRMMLNLMIDGTCNRALTGEGNLEQRAVDSIRVLIHGMRSCETAWPTPSCSTGGN